MKAINLLLILTVAVSFIYLSYTSKQVNTNSMIIHKVKLETYVIDSCEYIGIVYGGSDDFLSHKGNCKFCTKRNIVKLKTK